MPDTPAHLFISHATADDKIVTRLHDDLEAATGLAIWVDHEDILPGNVWQTAIDAALFDCPYLIVALSRRSYNRVEVMTEWRAALTYGHAVLPILLDDLPYEDIPPRLRMIQYVPMRTEAEWTAGIARLADVITGQTPPADPDAPHLNGASGFLRWPIVQSQSEPIDRKLTSIPLTGRDADLNAVRDKLKKAPTLLVGVGGLGKSRLAYEVVMTDDQARGAVWHVCTDISRPGAVIELLRDHYDLPVTADQPAVLERLRTHKRLIVLDNAESVPPEDSRRGEYVRLVNALHSAGAPVLLTSRVDWEELSPRAAHEPSPLSAPDAEQVVIDMGDMLNIDRDLAPHAAALAAAARFHPRLIEIAVGLLDKSDVERVLRQLNDLSGRKIQAALDEMLRRTMQQMQASEGEPDGGLALDVLRRLAVCRGGFTYAAAAAIILPSPPTPLSEEKGAVAGAPEENDESITKRLPADEDALDTALDILTRWRFVTYAPRTERYTIDPLVIAAAGEDTTAHGSHYVFYLALAKAHDGRQDYLGLDVERDNLDAAFENAFAAGNAADAFWMAEGVREFLANRGRFDQQLAWFTRLDAVLRPPPAPDATDQVVGAALTDAERLWAAFQNSLGNVYGNHPTGDRRANQKRAVACYTAALEYRTPQAAPLDYAMTQNNLGTAYRDLAALEDRAGNLARAVACYTAALEYWTPQAAPLDYALTQRNLGLAYEDLGQIEAAIACWREAEKYYRAMGDRTNADLMLEWIAGAGG